MMKNRKIGLRVGIAILIVLLLWWLYMAIWIDEESAFEAFLTFPKGKIIV